MEVDFHYGFRDIAGTASNIHVGVSMQTKWQYLLTEIRRTIRLFPRMLLQTVLLTAIIGAIAFAGVVRTGREPLAFRADIAVVVREDNRMTQMAVGYVESMESVSKLCRFLQTTEEEGFALLEKGEAAALILLPEGMIEGIMDGSNPTVDIFFPKHAGLEAMLFRELTESGAGLLRVAQAQIYGAGDAARRYGLAEQLSQMEAEIDSYNLAFALDRLALYDTEQVSAFGRMNAVQFYAASGMVLFLLLAGMALYPVLRREPAAFCSQLERQGAGRLWQCFCRWLSSVLCLSLFAGLMGTAGLAVMQAGPEDGVRALAGAGPGPGRYPAGIRLGIAGLMIVTAAALVCLLYSLAEDRTGGILLVFVSSVGMLYLSGGLVPSVFLPERVQRLGEWLPTAGLLRAAGALLTGQKGMMTGASWALLCGYTAACGMAVCLLQRRRRYSKRHNKFLFPALAESIYGSFCKAENKISNAVNYKSMGAGRRSTARQYWIWIRLLAGRLWRQPFFVGLLVFTPLLGFAAGLAGREESGGAEAAVCVEEGAWSEEIRALLEEQAADSVLRFVFCDGQGETERRVASGQADCGFVIAGDIREKVLAGRWRKTVTAYETDTSSITGMAKERIAGVIFRLYSEECYRESMGRRSEEMAVFAMEAYEDHLADGSTFGFRYVYGDSDSQFDSDIAVGNDNAVNSAVFPIKGVFGVLIFVSGMCGMLEYEKDKREKRFARLAPNWLTYMVNVWVPTVLVSAAVLACLWINDGVRSRGGPAESGLLSVRNLLGVWNGAAWCRQIAHMFLYQCILLLYCAMLRILLRRQETIAAAIPVLTLGSLLCAPVFIRLGAYLPVFAVLEKLFPVSYYLML